MVLPHPATPLRLSPSWWRAASAVWASRSSCSCGGAPDGRISTLSAISRDRDGHLQRCLGNSLPATARRTVVAWGGDAAACCPALCLLHRSFLRGRGGRARRPPHSRDRCAVRVAADLL